MQAWPADYRYVAWVRRLCSRYWRLHRGTCRIAVPFHATQLSCSVQPVIVAALPGRRASLSLSASTQPDPCRHAIVPCASARVCPWCASPMPVLRAPVLRSRARLLSALDGFHLVCAAGALHSSSVIGQHRLLLCTGHYRAAQLAYDSPSTASTWCAPLVHCTARL